MDGTMLDLPAPVKRGTILINRSFALLWGGQAISYVGDFVFDTTLILWVAARLAAGQSWAPIAVSGVLVAALAPTLLLGPVAGVFVDRWDKRHTMLAMDGVRAVLILALVMVSGALSFPFLGSLQLPVGGQLAAIYTAVVLCTCAQQFFGPSRLALIGDVVDPADQPRASAMTQITVSMAGIVGPPLAAPLFFGLGLQWALILNSLSFVASFVAILAVHAPESARSVAAGERADAWRELKAGLRFYARNRILVTILIAGTVIMLGAGALNALDYFFVVTNLHASPHLFGWLSASFGAGSVVGGILAGTMAGRIGPRRMFWIGMLAAGLGMLTYSRLTSFLPAAILLGFVGVPVAGVNIAIMPLLLEATPRDLIGRVAAVLGPALSFASIGSIGLAAVLVSTVLQDFHASALGLSFGPIDTIFSAGGILCLAGGIYAMVRLSNLPASATSSGNAVNDIAV